MASHRRPKPAGRTRVSIMTGLAAAAVALSAQSGAHADPAPTKDQVKEQVDQLNEQAEVATENYNGAQAKQQELQKQVAELQDKVARQQAVVTEAQGGLSEIAGEQYRTGGISQTVQLMLSASPDNFLSQADALNQAGSTQSGALKELQEQQRRLDQDRTETQTKLGELEATTQQLKTSKDEVQGKLAKAQQLLNTLTEQERQALRAAEEKAAAEAKAKADAAKAEAAKAAKAKADAERATRDTNRSDLSAPASAPAASAPAAAAAKPAAPAANGSRAAAAIAAAESKLGAPYVYGATGPNSFDCSGLTGWAYAQAGVSLPRTSQAQAGAGTRIGSDISQAQPGDLVIFYGDRHHVGIYVGGGQVIHAPKPGASVRYESASNMPVNSIVRL
ncbi:NlpC/P60 family protein [Kitasatospora purpeofusca]|uniref:C40 family peptidase n=1 Tax=Kitasatospora purpeofusca TaxID=67352 RepID=UPI00224C9BFE|nr:C40 family peptidase [Kitasatospora purpeofusca]MCX4752315.1 NlpC/P60 family protein [Kitasatospora purpeofusca]WSR31895.1 NlpC/P60 family protein [Kitasatospora purpeofusca]WSR39922.1 NlpC/P60 family protein [Kitasatospora purpeofusca]